MWYVELVTIIADMIACDALPEIYLELCVYIHIYSLIWNSEIEIAHITS